MRSLLELLDRPGIVQIGWALLHSLWQGVLIGVLFALMQLILKRRSANTRYAVGCLAMGLLIMVPVGTFFCSTPPVHMHNSSLEEVNPSAGIFGLGGRLGTGAEPALAIRFSRIAERFSMACAQFAPILTAAWLVGVLACSWRLTGGWLKVRALRQEHGVLDAEWLGILENLRRRLEISRPVSLIKSAFVEVPTLIGWLRPVILLPASGMVGLSPEQLEAVLVHELAHVRRHDYAVNIIQCLVETLLFYHPVVWWISRYVREEREHCCDDLVIKICQNRVTYARALMVLEEMRPKLDALALAVNGGSLLKRIQRLLGSAESGGRPSTRQVAGLALLGLGLVFILSGSWLSMKQPVYWSTARIKLENPVAHWNGGWGGMDDYDPYYLQTELEVFKSNALLLSVVQRLGLQQKWGLQRGAPLSAFEAASKLKRRIEIRTLRNPSLIEISVGSREPAEAGELANALVEAYRARRQPVPKEASAGSMEEWQKVLHEYENLKEVCQKKADRLRLELGIREPDGSIDPPALILTAGMLKRLEAMRVKLNSDCAREQAILEKLNCLTELQLVHTLPSVLPDALFSALLERRELAETRLSDLREVTQVDHELIQATSKLVEHLNSRINERAEGIMKNLIQRVSSTRESLNRLNASVEEAKRQDIHFANQNQHHLDAKLKFEELKKFHRAPTNIVSTEQMDEKLPHPRVLITDQAVPPSASGSQDRTRGLGLVLLGLMCNGTGLCLIRCRALPV